MDQIIPTHGNSYDTLNFVHAKCVSVYKKVGYTPLQVVQEIKPFLLPEEADKMTYVGRLDPMAEGWIHILWNGDMEEKAKLSSFDKTYEVEVIRGIRTDTGDVLGLIVDTDLETVQKDTRDFVGPFVRPYPAYSSPNIKKTLKGKKDEEDVRLQKGYISSIIEKVSICVDTNELQQIILNKLLLCQMPGDFRLEKVKERWINYFTQTKNKKYHISTYIIDCTSGTYMRTLAEDMGGFALSIKRIGFGKFVDIEK